MDNGSVYTSHLVALLHEKGIGFERQTPDTLDLRSLDGFDSFILSGRRHNAKKTNMLNSKIVLHAVAHGKKLLGICYGAEILALTMGGTIKRSHRPDRGEQRITICRPNPLCSGTISAFESHAFEISKLPESLVLLGRSRDCACEVIRHRQKPIFGTQFHPEMGLDGHHLIEKFCSL